MYHQLPAGCYQFLKDQQNYVLLESSRCDSQNCRSWLFLNPLLVLKVNSLAELPDFFEKLEAYLSEGYYLAGWLSYEAGQHFEKLPSQTKPSKPLAWFGVYQNPLCFNHRSGRFTRGDAALAAKLAELQFLPEPYQLCGLELAISATDYQQKLARIRDHLAAGDLYQVNFTTKYRFNVQGAAVDLYRELQAKQPVPYGALLDCAGLRILSCSPELFFRRQGERITTQPMKGTAPRGKTNAEDLQIQNWLGNDEKNRAENLMILDLLRNDLGRIARTGSVQVPEFFSVTRYPTLFQMTSTVTAQLRPEIRYYDIFRALFPCGSVTGAPKVRAMQLIKELEPEQRGVYTGAIGYFAPGGAAVFNVPIRTITIKNGKGELGVGSGIVYDSDPAAEYRETILKAEFLTAPLPEFQLIETMLWEQGYQLLAGHLDRMEQSAGYFDFKFERAGLVKLLQQNEAALEKGRRYKVRLLMDRAGGLTLENTSFEPERKDTPLLVGVARERTDARDRFLYHKTTRRQLYDQLYQKAVSQGFTEVIFMNQPGQITEGAISNLFIVKDGHWYTPPLDCGLLDGVFRSDFIKQQQQVTERVLTLIDLQTADQIYIGNALRGLRRVELAEPLFLE